ncbi:unnamed protein product [Albugo candida]|uniref:Uncharacterized protein n=1 Tax=Albugo candida TaxID=65357 RepID=A0A024FWA8_9STRA|nr:unnamed protein product [Albugo candida]|eukprot:CCI11202.1 unnamed protein product [Albugo candida]
MSFSPMKPYIHLTISTIDEERRFISGNVTVLQYNKKIILFSAASLKYSKMPIEPNQDSCYKKPFLKLQCSKVKCTLNGSTWRTSTLKITYASAHLASDRHICRHIFLRIPASLVLRFEGPLYRVHIVLT